MHVTSVWKRTSKRQTGGGIYPRWQGLAFIAAPEQDDVAHRSSMVRAAIG